MTEVPCLFIEDLTEAQKRAYILADNKLALDAGWDDEILRQELKALDDMNFDITIAGFDLQDLDFDVEDIEFEEDEYKAEPLAEPKAKLGDIYQLGNHRLMCGSSTSQEDVDKLLDGAVMDLCVTDPPYNVDYEGNAGKIQNDNMDDLSFYNFLYDFYTQMMNSLKEGGVYYIFHADTEGLNFRGALKKCGGSVKETLIWVKNALVLGRQDYHWKHEPCLYGWKEGARHYFINDRTQTTVFEDKVNLEKLTKGELIEMCKELMDEQVPTTIIHEDKPMRNDMHPTMKPVKLISRLVKNSSRPKENVIDFFGGSGSTLIACEQLNRTCYMMELDPKFCDVIIDRWEQYTGQKAKLITE